MNKYLFFPCILFTMLFLAGCEKDAQESDIGNNDGEPVPVNITIGEISEFEDEPMSKALSAEMVQTFIQPFDSIENPGIDIITTIEALPVRKKIETRANLNDGSSFRMFVYNKAGERVANNMYCINGTTVVLCSGIELKLVPGDYKFVCYTVNNNVNLDDSGTVNVINDMDFATCCFTQSISTTENVLTIIFKRQISQLGLAVSASGFANNTATYNSGLINNLGNIGTWKANFNSSDEIGLAVDGTNSIACTRNAEYLVLPVIRTLSITLNGLNVDGSNYGTKNISFPASFVRGKNYKITVQFSKDNSISAAGIRWAPGNLIIDGDNFYFAKDQVSYGSYVKSPIIGDPCRKVLPLDTWRMPTEADFRALINSGIHYQKTNPTGLVLDALLLTPQGYKDNLDRLLQVGEASSYWSIDRRNGSNIELYGAKNGSVSLGYLNLIDGCSSAIRCVRK